MGNFCGYSMQAQIGKIYVAWQEELKVVRKNGLSNFQPKCVILKLRNNNLIENIANQDKIPGKKLNEKKRNLIVLGLWCDKNYRKC